MIESLLDEFNIPFGHVTLFSNGNCFISFFPELNDPLPEREAKRVVNALYILGFNDVQLTDEDLIWFSYNGKTIEENTFF